MKTISSLKELFILYQANDEYSIEANRNLNINYKDIVTDIKKIMPWLEWDIEATEYCYTKYFTPQESQYQVRIVIFKDTGSRKNQIWLQH